MLCNALNGGHLINVLCSVPDVLRNVPGVLHNVLRSDIKSSGKFPIFRRLKIEGGKVKLVNYGKIETKDRNY